MEVTTMARQRRHSRPSRRRGRFGGLYKVMSVLLIAAAVITACVVFFRVNAIQVEGNVRYTPEEIIDASGIQLGDNLIALSRGRISAGIRAQLPYVEGVAIHRSYPDKLVIRVTERVAAASVDSAEGRRRRWIPPRGAGSYPPKASCWKRTTAASARCRSPG